MPKVFYSENPNSSPPGDRDWAESGSGSEAETEIENYDVGERLQRRKPTHRRTETMDVDAELQIPPKRSRPVGNAVMRQKQTSREVRDATGQRPLQKACSRSDLARVEELLLNKPDLQDRDYAGTTALHTAALQGDASIVRALLKAGAVPDVRSGPQELDTPLMDAAANGYLSIVEMLIAAGADPRVSNATGRIAVDFVDEDNDESEAIVAALEAQTTVLRKKGVHCISSPSDPDAPEGLFPPGFAAIQRPAAPMFLDVSKRSFRQEIVEHASTGDLEYIGLALERGWQPSAEALVKAAKFGHSEIVGLLLAFGLNADSKFEGVSAISEAIRRSHLETVKLLLDSGASLKSQYRNLVADLPDWDELRALVMRVPPAPKPKEKLLARKEDIVEPKPVESKRYDETKHVKVELKQDDSKTKQEVNKVETKPSETKQNETRQSPIDGLQLSKIGLRSIKPKKRSKSIAEGASHTKNESHNNEDVMRSATVPIIPEVPSKPEEPAEPKKSTRPSPLTVSIPQNESSSAPDSPDLAPSSAPSSEASLSSAPSVPSSTTHSAPVSSSGPRNFDQKVSSSKEPSQEPSSRDSSRAVSVSGEMWEERSQELSELAQRKAKQRRDREVRMLESLAQEQRRRSGSLAQNDSPAEAASVSASPFSQPSPKSPKEAESVASPVEPAKEGVAGRVVNKNFSMEEAVKHETSNSPAYSPDQTPQTAETDQTTKQQEVSVSQLPWVLRQLAYSGKPQSVAPLLTHTMSGTKYYVDVQVSLAFGEPQLHVKHPKLSKVLVTSQQQNLLWSFCSPWLCRPKSSTEEIAAERQKFLQLSLSWVRVDEIETLVAASSPLHIPSIAIQLEPSPALPKRDVGIPLQWMRRAEIASSLCNKRRYIQMFAVICASASAIGPVLREFLPPQVEQALFSKHWLSSVSIAWVFLDARWLELLVGTRKFVFRSALLFTTGYLAVSALGASPNPFALAMATKAWEVRAVPLTWEVRIGKYLQLYPAIVQLTLLAFAIQTQSDLINAIVGISLGIPMSMVK